MMWLGVYQSNKCWLFPLSSAGWNRSTYPQVQIACRPNASSTAPMTRMIAATTAQSRARMSWIEGLLTPPH